MFVGGNPNSEHLRENFSSFVRWQGLKKNDVLKWHQCFCCYSTQMVVPRCHNLERSLAGHY